MSRRPRPLWKFEHENSKNAVLIPLNLLYQNGNAIYYNVPPMIVLPKHLKGATHDVLKSTIKSILQQYDNEGCY